jgi:leucyl/phenylalanyl-tRNA--protein transferase
MRAPIVLTPQIVLQAYRRGAFPMGDPLTNAIEWYDPNPRAVVPLDGLHVTRTLRRVYRSGRFLLRSDAAFEAVIDACSAREPTWITPPIRAAYVALHGQGHAHSVEAWRGDRLVGGLYGVHLGGAFMGESMFHVATDASKVCLVALVELLRGAGFVLLDTQFLNDHLASFGAVEISRGEYRRRLDRALALSTRWPARAGAVLDPATLSRPPAFPG